MSSATPVNPYASTSIIANIGDRAIGKADDNEPAPIELRELLSPRQRALFRLWLYYRCENYASRKVDWNGGSAQTAEDREMIATSGFTPPGFYDAGATMPIEFRRPTAPAHFARIIVDRYTALLFSQRRHPRITVEGDPDTEDYMGALAKEGGLWSAIVWVRTFGGAMGSAALSFKLVRGRPVFEAHDGRWCTPVFADRAAGVLSSIEIKYPFSEDVRNPDTGAWEKAWFWYRRVIDEESDEVWPKVPVRRDEDPDWTQWKSARVEHNVGRCPVVWVQNVKSVESIDGDPDCHGAYDLIEAHDVLMSQANKSVLANCDPTLVVATDTELDAVSLGSDNALKLEKGGSATFAEVNGAASKQALDLADRFKQQLYELTAYVPDEASDATRTATEVNARVSRMFERADMLREQYGAAIVQVLEVAEDVCRSATRTQTVKVQRDDGATVEVKRIGVIRLTRKTITDPETGDQAAVPRKLGHGGIISLKWGRYFDPTLDDIEKAARAVTTANGGAAVIDDEVAATFAAQYFPVDDVQQLLARVRRAAKEAAEAQQAELEAALGGGGAPPNVDPQGPPAGQQEEPAGQPVPLTRRAGGAA